MMKILIINGPNMNLLGRREPDKYGEIDIAKLNDGLKEWAAGRGVELELFQSNCENEIVERIQASEGNADAIVINPAAFTHYSVAIRDALASVQVPAVEVHITKIMDREEFRGRSITAPAVKGIISGFGADSYRLGLEAALNIIQTGKRN